MGASQSISGHVAHPEAGWRQRHRLKRVARNEVQGQCRVCSQPAKIGEVAYRCRATGCTVVLHEACYHRPKKMNYFAHSCSRRPITLTDVQKVPAGRRTCSICAVGFDVRGGAAAFVYGCGRCHGFYAHLRCCDLQQKIPSDLHKQHALTLLPPQPRNGGRGRSHSRRCISTLESCKNARRNSDAWSYQCSLCDVELCLKCCQLPDGGGPAAAAHNDGNVLGTVAEVVQQLATVTGMTLNALACACIGNPKTPTPLPEPAPK